MCKKKRFLRQCVIFVKLCVYFVSVCQKGVPFVSVCRKGVPLVSVCLKVQKWTQTDTKATFHPTPPVTRHQKTFLLLDKWIQSKCNKSLFSAQ